MLVFFSSCLAHSSDTLPPAHRNKQISRDARHDRIKNAAAPNACITPRTNPGVIEDGYRKYNAAFDQVLHHGKFTFAYRATSANRPTTCEHRLSLDTNLPVMPCGVASISTMS